MTHLGDPTPGSDTRLPPRAWLRSDAPVQSLDGDWAFLLHDSDPGDDLHGPPPFAAVDSDASEWDLIPVPSHWGLHGHGHPTYTNIRYPFPLDPPHVPDHNPTGDHRRVFEWHSSFCPGGRTLLRFEGVESLATVWLNGTEIGWFTGSRLMTEFDVTDHLVDGENVLAVRVHQWSAASYLEDQDQWWLPGIFRSVSLQGRPANGLDDVFVRGDRDPATGAGTLDVRPRGGWPVTVRVPELGIDETWADATDATVLSLDAVDAWTAETPRLYDVEVSTDAETVRLRVGFRRIEIVGDRLLADGRPLIFRGVNRHETDPDRGRVFDEEYVRGELALMRRHNIAAIRTAHQPPHPRMLELADELGFWVVLECDLETHGFWDVEWTGNPADDPAWRAACLDRVRRTVERDKNHSSIVMWSLGNESGTGRNLAEMAGWIRERDDSRPIHYEGDYGGAYTDVYSRMYPTLEEIASVCGEQTMPVHEIGPAEGARQRAKPFVLCEFAHAMGNGPGSLADYEALVERYPRLHGGFVWEWRDHGIRTRTADGTEFFAYGGDFGEPVHDGVYLMDGLVLSDGTPSPGLGELAAVWAPVTQEHLGEHSWRVRNRQHTLGTDHLELHWRIEDDGIRLTDGIIALPALAPGEEGTVEVPVGGLQDAATERWLTLEVRWRDAPPWGDAGHIVSRAQRPLRTAPPCPPRRSRAGWDGDALGEAVFDRRGGLVRWRDLDISGPLPELWRAPTENDQLDGQGSYETADPALTNGRGDESTPASSARWLERGLDRLQHRVLSVERADDGLVQRVRSMAAHSAQGIETTFAWRLDGDALRLHTDIRPFGPWDCTWPRVGARFGLPVALADERAEWFGTGPAESYPDSAEAAYVGRFEARVDDLGVAYGRPQETGYRPGLRALDLGPLRLRAVASGSTGLPGFQLDRHTAQERTGVAHAHELPASSGLWLYLDAAQHGLGSRACGPDVLPRYALWPRAVSWTVVLE
jgi:beta-galactosidase